MPPGERIRQERVQARQVFEVRRAVRATLDQRLLKRTAQDAREHASLREAIRHAADGERDQRPFDVVQLWEEGSDDALADALEELYAVA